MENRYYVKNEIKSAANVLRHFLFLIYVFAKNRTAQKKLTIERNDTLNQLRSILKMQ